MKKAIATIAAVASLAIAAPQSAEAAGACYQYTASREIDTLIAGGYSLDQAWNALVEEGTVNNSHICWTRVSGNIRQVGAVYPYAFNAIWR